MLSNTANGFCETWKSVIYDVGDLVIFCHELSFIKSAIASHSGLVLKKNPHDDTYLIYWLDTGQSFWYDGDLLKLFNKAKRKEIKI